jgi:opacity protein-like surface antigen
MSYRPSRQTLTALLFVSASILATATDARAQAYVAPLIGYDYGGDSGCPEISNCEDKKVNYGVGFGAMGAMFGIEQEIAYAQNFFGEAPGLQSSVLTVMSSLMIGPNLKVARPYFLVGMGLIKTNIELTPASLIGSLLGTDNNSFGWDVGGGVMIFFGPHIGIRGDIRHFHTFNDLDVLEELEQYGISFGGKKLSFGRAAAALVIQF